MAPCEFLLMLVSLVFLSNHDAKAIHMDRFDAQPESRVPLIYNGVVYACDFESEDQCNFKTYGQLDGTGFMITNKLNFMQNEVFTDMNSISLTTANGLKCQIPYQNYGQDYYFCNPELECQTSLGFSRCRNGYFLGGILRERNQSQIIYFGQVVRGGPLNVNMYELSFYAFMDCKYSVDCWTANDKIRVYLYNGPFEYDVVEVKFSDFEGTSKWKRFSVRIGNVYQDPNLRMEFLKDPYFNETSHTFFGIDNIQIAYSSDDPRRVTKCDFDTNHCTLDSMFRNETYVSLRSSMKSKFYERFITDVSSTTKKAKNGEFCQFPFTYQGERYIFCTESNQCLTAKGMSECAEGRFVGGYMPDKAWLSSASIRLEFYANPISFNKFGNFSLTFNAFMFCDADPNSCLSSHHYLTVSADATVDMEKSFDREYFRGRIGWTKISIDLYIEPYDKLWITFLFNLNGSSTWPTYYGLDEIELIYLDKLDPDQFSTSTTTQALPRTTNGQLKTTSTLSLTFLGALVAFTSLKLI